ncbi:MAG: TonB-dependent receptor [Flavobacteriales bacterium]|nr:TonB-dependent receptor [Flavobacteriales bacterium]MBL6873007.1 TonB-dependent receptor [Flavobacteriales bacterium]
MTKPVILSPTQKALQINLDSTIYGTFAEIGAGQEVVRHFFRAGGASGTIAKTMSAYDKDFSDAIYGKEIDGRYVSKSRLKKILKQEYGLIENRLRREEHPDKKYFSFANTLATINYTKTVKGHGWMGCRFQTAADKGFNEVIFHVRLNDSDAKLQQETIGIMGTNLIYACFNHYYQPKTFIKSLYDNLTRDNVEMDMIQMEGPDFKDVDNRLLSLILVKEGMTDAVIFGPDGKNQQPSDVLYKKNILTIRGSFRPVTKVNLDMMENGYNSFIEENRVDKDNVQLLFEITLSNLKMEGDIDENDFLDRADILCSLGHTVLISNYKKYYKLIEYFSNYTKARMGLIIGVNNLLEIFDDKYYRNLNGGILEAFGILFTRDLKIYLYPYQADVSDELLNSKNIPIHRRLRPLYDYLLKNGRIKDLKFNDNVLQIFSRDILHKIKKKEDGWQDGVPEGVSEIILNKKLFGVK